MDVVDTLAGCRVYTHTCVVGGESRSIAMRVRANFFRRRSSVTEETGETRDILSDNEDRVTQMHVEYNRLTQIEYNSITQ